MNTISVVIFFVQQQFPLQISSSPERYVVEILSADRADQSFDEWMRERNVRYCLDLHRVENSPSAIDHAVIDTFPHDGIVRRTLFVICIC